MSVINTNTSATPNVVTGSNQVPLSAFAQFEHTSAPLAIACRAAAATRTTHWPR